MVGSGEVSIREIPSVFPLLDLTTVPKHHIRRRPYTRRRTPFPAVYEVGQVDVATTRVKVPLRLYWGSYRRKKNSRTRGCKGSHKSYLPVPGKGPSARGVVEG